MLKQKYVKPSERPEKKETKEPKEEPKGTKKEQTKKVLISVNSPDFLPEDQDQSIGGLIEKNLTEYGHLFLGTNDFEIDLLNVQEKIDLTENFQNVKSVALVSNGWMFILHAFFKKSKDLKHVFFYDTNPIMLMIYDTLVQLILISENIQMFIKHIFCRDPKSFTFKSNEDQTNFLNQEFDKNIYNSVCKKIKKKISLETYKSLFFKYAIESKKFRNVYPTFYFENTKDKESNLIDGKKLHTTQQIKNIYHYFTTFYLNVIEPFITNDCYQSFRARLSKCEFYYTIQNIYDVNFQKKLLEDKKVKSYKQLAIYIDGIDDEYCYYLSNTRKFLFQKMQAQVKQKIYILSTKSGVTSIDKNQIIEVSLLSQDVSSQKEYKRIQNNKYIPKTKTAKPFVNLIKQLNHKPMSIVQSNLSHFDGLKKIVQDKRVMAHISNGQIETDQKLKSWVFLQRQLEYSESDMKMDQSKREYFNYTLFINNKIKGLFRVSKQQFVKENPKEFYIRFFLSQDVQSNIQVWGQGYASAFLADYCIPEFKKSVDVDKLVWACESTNEPSNCIAKRLNGKYIEKRNIFGQDYHVYYIFV